MKMTMRKLLAILATLAMLCTVLPLGTLFSAAADNANLFVNGDFETGTNDSWDTYQGSATTADAAKNGSYGFNAIGNGGWGGMFNQTVAVEAGKEYKLSFWIKIVSNGVNVQVKQDNSSGASIDGSGKGWYDANKYGEWTLIENTFVAPSDAIFFNVCGAGNGKAESAYFDDITLVCLDGTDKVEPSFDGYITNGDFETGDLTAWTNLWGSCTVGFVAGKDSANAISITAGSWQQVRQNEIAVEKNTDYVVSAWMKDATNFGLIVKSGDDSKDIKSNNVSSIGDWTEVTVEFNSGDFDSVCVLLIGWDGGGSAIVDNVTMVKKAGGETPDTPDEPDEPDEPVTADPSFDGYLYNGDFETGVLADGWQLDTGSQLSGISADAAKDGKYGFKLEGDAYGEILFSHTIPQTEGATYTLEFDAKALNRGKWQLQVKRCAGDNPRAGNNLLTENIEVTTVGEWAHYTYTFAADISADRDHFALLFVVTQDTDFCIDNVVIKSDAEPEEPSEPELPAGTLTDDDFNDGTLGAWASTSDVSNDNGALKFNVTADYANIYAYATAEKNTDYVITFKAKSALGKSMWVKFNKAWASDIAKETIALTTSWSEYTVTLNSGDNTDLVLLFQYAGTAADGECIWFDYITIKKAGGSDPVDPVDPPAPTGNLIVNGDFESGNTDGWTVYSSTAATADAAKNGSYGIMAQGDGGWGGLLNQTISVVAGEEYTLSYWVKAVKNGVNVQIKENDWQGASIEGAGAGYYSNTEWKYVENTFVMPCDVLYINVCGSGILSTDCVYFDDFKLTKVGADEPPVAGDSYTEDFESGNLDGWQIEGEGGVGIYTEDAHGGNKSLIVRGDFMEDYKDLAYGPTIALKGGCEYTLTFWVKSLKKGATGFSIIYRENADRTGELGDFQKLTWPTFETEWTQKTYILRPEVDGYVGLNFIRVNADILVDDISIVQTGGGDSTDTNVLVNGGFENGSDGWKLNESMATIVDDARTGKGALQLANVGMWSEAAFQVVNVKPNTNYVIELWYKREVGTKPFNLFYMNGETFANLTRVEGSGDNWFNTADSSWTQRIIIVNTGDATTMALKWSAEVANDGVMLIDDMMVYPEGERPGEPEALNPVINGGFETGDLTGWINLWNSCTVTVIDPGHDNSKYAIEVITNGSWQQVRQNEIPVEPNTDYVVEAYVRNSNNMGIVIKEGFDSFDLTAFEVGQIPDDNSNTWKKHVFEFNTGKDKDGNAIDPIESICLLIISPDGGSSVEIDDIKLFKKSEYNSGSEYAGPMTNSGFETGDLTGWTNLWNSCTVNFETPGRNDSKFALDFSADGQWKQVRQDNIPVEPNTDYVVLAHAKNPKNVNIVVKTEDDKTNIADYKVADDSTNKWVRYEIEFNSGAETAVSVLLITNSENGGSALWDDVQIFKKGEVPADDGGNEPVVTEGPLSLDKYTVPNNRPTTPDANLIINGSFEDAEGGQWMTLANESVFSIVEDETAPEGNKSLYFNTSGVAYDDKAVFYVDVEPNTDYVFSAWVKGAYISDDNRFQATFGVIDYKGRFATYDDHVFSNVNRQIVPTAWDNEWHLRSVQFNSGVNIKVGIAITGGYSQMWLDGLALFKVDEGIKYTGEKQVSYIIASPLYADEGGCAEENSLIPDVNMDGAEAKEFWSSAEGYKNGFLSFAENKYEYGTSLKYTASEKAVGTYAIKWLDVEPNTTYTFSVDMRIIKSGAGKLVMLDGKMRECYNFLMVDFDKEGYGEDWFTIAVEFNTGVFDRIGIAVADGGGEALIDNMRLFESKNRATVEDDFVEPPYGYDDPEDPEDPNEPGSPSTGVSVMGAVLAMALVPSSAAVALKLRRKKEDEE